MLTLILGSLIAIAMVIELREPIPENTSPSTEIWVPDAPTQSLAAHKLKIKSGQELAFNNITRQEYDYSCGSAALTTLYRGYLGLSVSEQQVMVGMLKFGETERIQSRRSFSMLDMKRLTEALGYPSGGFSAEMSDLEHLEHPAIVSINYAGFRHFVVIKAARSGKVYVADPAMGHRSFTYPDFEELWEQKVLFMAFPGEKESFKGLALTGSQLREVNDSEEMQKALLVSGLEHSAFEMGEIDQRLQSKQYNAYWVQNDQGGRRLVTEKDSDYQASRASTFYTPNNNVRVQVHRYRP